MAPRICLQLHVGTKSPAYVRTHTLAALRALAESQGLREVQPHEDAQRLWAVGPSAAAPWVAVEELSEATPEAESLAEICCTLSETLATQVLGVLVHSSRTLYLCLGDEGAVVDEYCTEPAFFGEDEGWRRALDGDATHWGPLLRSADPAALLAALDLPSRTSDALVKERAQLRDALLALAPPDVAQVLTAVFTHPARSAEEQLRRLGALLRFDPRFNASPQREAFEKLEAKGFTLLRLAALHRPTLPVEEPDPGFEASEF